MCLKKSTCLWCFRDALSLLSFSVGTVFLTVLTVIAIAEAFPLVSKISIFLKCFCPIIMTGVLPGGSQAVGGNRYSSSGGVVPTLLNLAILFHGFTYHHTRFIIYNNFLQTIKWLDFFYYILVNLKVFNVC